MSDFGALKDNLSTFPDYFSAQDFFFQNGLTDGLPIVPPVLELVGPMLAMTKREPGDVLGIVENRTSGITVEQAAVCAVMAGALPSYFPVVLAIWEAIFDPGFNAGAVLGSSGGAAVTAVVSGQYARQIGMNSEKNLFGPGNRANATIGRAIRLGLLNALGYRVGELDGAAFGNQARYTSAFAERTPPPGWMSLNARLGYGADATTVTVAPTDAPRQMTHILSGDAENVLKMLTASMQDGSHCAAGRGTTFFILLGPEHTAILHEAGWTIDAIRDRLSESSRVLPEFLEAAGAPLREDRLPVEHGDRMELRADGTLPTADAGDIFVVTAGGTGAGWSQVLFGYAPRAVFRAVTREVVLP